MLGQVIGHYKIESIVKKLPYGTEYTASHHNDVKLKVNVIHVDSFVLSNKVLLSQMRSEWRKLMMLDHSSIRRHLDIYVQKEMVAIVTENFSGYTLRQLLQKRPISYQRVIELGERLLSALAYRHSNKIGNLLWTPDMIFICDDGRVKILDIGVQQVLEKAQNKGPSAGSMPYVAPELLTDGKPVPASDLYSFGLILWEMLVGKKACERNDLYGMMWWHTTVGAPDVRSVMENQQVPPLLAKFILACTATNQGMRPSNAQVALQAWQQSIAPLLMQQEQQTPISQQTTAFGQPQFGNSSSMISAEASSADNTGGMGKPLFGQQDAHQFGFPQNQSQSTPFQSANPYQRRTIPTTQTDASRVRQNFWQTAKPSSHSQSLHSFHDDISQTMPLHRAPNTQQPLDTSKVQFGERSISKSTIFFASLSMFLIVLLIYNINPTGSTEGNANVVSNDNNSDNDNASPNSKFLYPTALMDKGSRRIGNEGIDRASTDKEESLVVIFNNMLEIGTTEVSQRLYLNIMDYNPVEEEGNCHKWNPDIPPSPDMPVYCVSFKDAVTFANKLSIQHGYDPCYNIDEMTENVSWPQGTSCTGWRLPTEAEWEAGSLYTKNGHDGNSSIYAGGKFPNDVAWHKGNSNGMPHEVAQLKPTDIGLYDMSGNVAEWVWDYHADYPSQAQTDYTGPLSGTYRVIRGGSWEGDTRYVRVMYRGKTLPTSKSDNLGFRVVRSIIK